MEVYYFKDVDERLIYLSAISMDQSIECSLYVDDQLVKRRSLHPGEHSIEYEDITTELHVKLFKMTATLEVGKKELRFEKIKRKKLKSILSRRNIHNDINPLPRAAEPLDPKVLMISIGLIVIGAVCFFIINK